MFRRIGALRLNAFAATPLLREAAPAATANSNNKPSQNKRPNDNLKQVFEVPPRVDFRHLGKAVEDGYFIRLQFTRSAVLLKRSQQNKPADATRIFSGPESNLQIPSTTVSRMLAVMDGYMDECQVIGRQFQGTFKADAANPNTFVLQCKGTATLKSDEKDGAATSVQTEWTSAFDVADSILLHRFLKNSLHYMQGFYHSEQE